MITYFDNTVEHSTKAWRICLVAICFGIFVCGNFFPKNSTGDIPYLVSFNMPIALIMWAIFHVVVGRNSGNKHAWLFSFFSIFCALIVSDLVSYTQQQVEAPFTGATKMIYLLLVVVPVVWSKKTLTVGAVAKISACVTFPLCFLASVGSQPEHWSMDVALKHTAVYGTLCFLINVGVVRILFFKRFKPSEQLQHSPTQARYTGEDSRSYSLSLQTHTPRGS